MKTAPWAALSALLVAGCQCAAPASTATEPAEAHHDEEAHEAMPRQVRISEEVWAASGIKMEIAKRTVLAATVGLPGEVVAVPDKTARVSAAAAGRLDHVSFNEGSVVKKGDVLAVLRVPDVGRLRGAFAAVLAKAKASRANAARLESLQDAGLGSSQAVLDADADANAQEAESRAISEQLAAIGVSAEGGGGVLVPLRAPISGIVVARDAVVGQPIDAEHVLATIVDLSEVWFLGRIFEKDLDRLRVGAKAEVQLNAFPRQQFHGVVDYVGQQIDPVARTLTARVLLTNDNLKLRLGLFGSAHVEVSEPSTATPQLVISRSAVTEVGSKSVVFVKAKDGDFVVHEVTLGDAALGQVQVLSGLDEGEEVVTSGVFTLKSLLLKSTLSEDD